MSPLVCFFSGWKKSVMLQSVLSGWWSNVFNTSCAPYTNPPHLKLCMLPTPPAFGGGFNASDKRGTVVGRLPWTLLFSQCEKLVINFRLSYNGQQGDPWEMQMGWDILTWVKLSWVLATAAYELTNLDWLSCPSYSVFWLNTSLFNSNLGWNLATLDPHPSASLKASWLQLVRYAALI